MVKKVLTKLNTFQHSKTVRHANHAVYVAYYAFAMAEDHGVTRLCVVSAVMLIHTVATLTGDEA